MSKVRGFSLIELMVAMGLGAALLTASLSALGASMRRHEEARSVARLDEQASFVFGLLEPELQMAGYGGLQPLTEARWPATLPPGARACGSLIPGAPAVRIATHWHEFTCAAQAGGAVDEAHVLVITRASGRAATAERGRLQVVSSAGLTPPPTIGDGGDLSSEGTGSSRRNLVHALYYLARVADAGPNAGPALRMKELTAIAGNAAFRDLELADGIEDLRFDEGWRASDDADAPLQWSAPGERPSHRPVEGVRVTLHLRSERRFGGTPVRQIAVRDFTVRNLPDRGFE